VMTTVELSRIFQEVAFTSGTYDIAEVIQIQTRATERVER